MSIFQVSSRKDESCNVQENMNFAFAGSRRGDRAVRHPGRGLQRPFRGGQEEEGRLQADFGNQAVQLQARNAHRADGYGAVSNVPGKFCHKFLSKGEIYLLIQTLSFL